MTQYSVEPRNRIFINGYGFLFFDSNDSKLIGKDIIKYLSNKCCQKLLHHAKQSAPMYLKLLQNIADTTGDLTGNKVAEKVAKVS